MTDWRHRDVWCRRAATFAVEVVRHSRTPGEHLWNVYAYIYEAHWHFGEFDGDRMWQDAATALPLHSYPSYLRYHRDSAGDIVSVQVGSDYNHLGDERCTGCATRDEAGQVFADAERLVDWLNAGGPPAEQAGRVRG